MAKYYVGTSSRHYEHWSRLFYPERLPKAKWLEFYAQQSATVELNNSFYHLSTERAFGNWRNSAPAGFMFAVKVSRFITHIKRLRNVKEPLENFLSRTAFLQDKLGPLLYQLLPDMKRNGQLLKAFLSILPSGCHHVIEFRHKSWIGEEVFDLLRRHSVGLCVFDMPDFTCPAIATADFAYYRFHGSTSLFASCYS